MTDHYVTAGILADTATERDTWRMRAQDASKHAEMLRRDAVEWQRRAEQAEAEAERLRTERDDWRARTERFAAERDRWRDAHHAQAEELTHLRGLVARAALDGTGTPAGDQ